MQIKWKKINDYCISHNQINITKAIVENGQKFIVWHNSKLIEIFRTSNEAKAKAISLIAEQSAVTDSNITRPIKARTLSNNYDKGK